MLYNTVTVDAEISSIVTVDAEITGIIDTVAEIEDIIDIDAEVDFEVEAEADLTEGIDAEATLYTKIRSGDAETYEGSYEVTPLARTEQTLETADKLMMDDVTVHRVPYYETSNPYGTTVYIAEV